MLNLGSGSMWDLPHAQASCSSSWEWDMFLYRSTSTGLEKSASYVTQLVGCKMSQCFTIFSCACVQSPKRENGMVTTASSTLCCTLLANPKHSHTCFGISAPCSASVIFLMTVTSECTALLSQRSGYQGVSDSGFSFMLCTNLLLWVRVFLELSSTSSELNRKWA